MYFSSPKASKQLQIWNENPEISASTVFVGIYVFQAYTEVVCVQVFY